MPIMDDYDEGFQDGRDDFALELITLFKEKINELKETDELSRNQHIDALESHIKLVKKSFYEKKPLT